MRMARLTMAGAGLLFVLASTAAAEVRLTITNGQVSVSAKNATVAQILAEWAKVAPTRIVNAERVSATPITIEFADLTEVQALDILLRSAGGYVLAPRATAAASGSKFDRMLILPVGGAPRPTVSVAPVTFPRSQLIQPAPQDADTATDPEPDVQDEPDDQPDSVRPPVFRTFPLRQEPDDPTPPPPPARPSTPAGSPTLTAPMGVQTPGMLPPAPPPAAGAPDDPDDPADPPR